jgi:DNA-binding IclR family transcriptional regulator
MRSTERDGAGPSVLGRVIAVLDAFDTTTGCIAISELGRRTGLPKSTVHRLVGELISHGFLERDDAGVRLGLRLFELGQLVPRQRHLRDIAAPYMADLREATRHTVHLAMLDGTEVLYVNISHGPDSPKLPSRVGGRLPAHATGVGKAILAFSPQAVIDRVLQKELVRLSPRTIVAPGLLLQQLEAIRRRGVAFDNEESSLGTVCAASPVFGPEGEVVAALSVTGWSNRANLQRLGPAVHTAALGITRSLRSLGQLAPR